MEWKIHSYIVKKTLDASKLKKNVYMESMHNDQFMLLDNNYHKSNLEQFMPAQ